MAIPWDLTSFPFTAGQVAMGLGIFVLSTVVTTAVVTAYLVTIPPDHFDNLPLVRRRQIGSSPARLALAIGKNVLGAVLVIVGLVLSVPGVPGQGLLTILVGILLLDIPGKRKLERRLVSRPAVLRNINKLRTRFDRSPLKLGSDGDDA